MHITGAPQINLIKLGTEYGGFTIPDGILSSKSICYSAGAGEDISLEIELISKYGCQVYLFDPTPRAIAHVNKVKSALEQGSSCAEWSGKYFYQLPPKLANNLIFLPIGLWDNNTTLKFFLPKNPAHVSASAHNLQNTVNYFEAPCKSLKSLMNDLGHQYIDLLKMNIEGAEYPIILHMIDQKILPTILCVEFHALPQFNKNQFISLLKQNGYLELNNKNNRDYTFILNPSTTL